MITKGDVLLSLRPGAEWNVVGGVITWLDTEQTEPTADEIRDELVRLQYKAEVEDYKEKRAGEYPPKEDYLDGVVKNDQDQIDAYVAACQAVKDKYPKATMDDDELASRQAQALFDEQAINYTNAKERLEQYLVSEGKESITTTEVIGQDLNDETNEFEDVVITTETPAIDPVPATVDIVNINDDGEEVVETIENPLITKDKLDRAAAQDVVDNTPKAVKDHVDGV
jgi:hypothetical protein